MFNFFKKYIHVDFCVDFLPKAHSFHSFLKHHNEIIIPLLPQNLNQSRIRSSLVSHLVVFTAVQEPRNIVLFLLGTKGIVFF